MFFFLHLRYVIIFSRCYQFACNMSNSSVPCFKAPSAGQFLIIHGSSKTVLQGDIGGERVLQKKWTTFLKAQLLCSLPDDGFPFNIIQDMFVLTSTPEDWKNTVFYGVFTSQWLVLAFLTTVVHIVFQIICIFVYELFKKLVLTLCYIMICSFSNHKFYN